MLEWFKRWFGEEQLTAENLMIGSAMYEATTGAPFFSAEDCPVSKAIKKTGMATRVIPGTRNDN